MCATTYPPTALPRAKNKSGDRNLKCSLRKDSAYFVFYYAAIMFMSCCHFFTFIFTRVWRDCFVSKTVVCFRKKRLQNGARGPWVLVSERMPRRKERREKGLVGRNHSVVSLMLEQNSAGPSQSIQAPAKYVRACLISGNRRLPVRVGNKRRPYLHCDMICSSIHDSGYHESYIRLPSG